MMGAQIPGAAGRRIEPVRTLEARKVIPVFASVVVLVAAIAFFDIFLVRTAARHKVEAGTRLYRKGLDARARGRTAEALESFRAAYNRMPQNQSYHLAFALALDASGREPEGRAALTELLNRQPAYGPANAEMARVLARSGNWQRAAWYYHRALYGEWPGGSPDLRALRFELADLLARHGAREQLVSEVVLLGAEPAEESEAEHLARLHLAAGEWERAQDMYLSLLRTDAGQPQLLAGLARAQIGIGRYVAAERTLRRAVAAGATDPEVSRYLELVTRANALDPTIRGLQPSEKHRHAHELATILLSALESCSPQNAELQGRRRELTGHSRRRDFLALAESDLDTFEVLWGERRQFCVQGAELPAEVELLAAELTR